MYIESTILGYIDPNTSQQVFSLFGPILAFLAAAGGLVVTGLVLLRHRIVSFFRRASWAGRLVVLSITAIVLTAVAVVIYRLI